MRDDYGLAGMVGAAIVAIGGALVSFIVSAVNAKKVNHIAETFDKTYKEISKKDFSTDLSQEFIEKIGKDKIEREMERRLRDIKYEALKSADKSFRAVIQKEINEQYSDTKADVKRALAERVGQIDISDVKREVVADARDIAAKEFKKETERIATNFAQNLESTLSINKTISDYMKSK